MRSHPNTSIYLSADETVELFISTEELAAAWFDLRIVRDGRRIYEVTIFADNPLHREELLKSLVQAAHAANLHSPLTALNAPSENKSSTETSTR